MSAAAEVATSRRSRIDEAQRVRVASHRVPMPDVPTVAVEHRADRRGSEIP